MIYEEFKPFLLAACFPCDQHHNNEISPKNDSQSVDGQFSSSEHGSQSEVLSHGEESENERESEESYNNSDTDVYTSDSDSVDFDK